MSENVTVMDKVCLEMEGGGYHKRVEDITLISLEMSRFDFEGWKISPKGGRYHIEDGLDGDQY